MKKIILIVLLVQLFGCAALDVGEYQPDFDMVNNLKDINARSMSVGEFTEVNPELNQVSLRGSPMVSQYEGSYGKYLKYSLEEQLAQANLLAEASDLVISGELLENTVSAAGISTASAKLAAQFVISKSGEELYSQKHEIYHEWESSFVGAVAIPRAQNNYPIAVQKLINDFLTEERVMELIAQ